MATHEEIENSVFHYSPDTLGTFFRMPADKVPALTETDLEPLFGLLQPLGPKYEHLLLSAPLLYKQLTNLHNMNQLLIDIIERSEKSKDNDAVVKLLGSANKSILLAQLAAQSGTLKIAKMMQQDEATKGPQ